MNRESRDCNAATQHSVFGPTQAIDILIQPGLRIALSNLWQTDRLHDKASRYSPIPSSREQVSVFQVADSSSAQESIARTCGIDDFVRARQVVRGCPCTLCAVLRHSDDEASMLGAADDDAERM